MAPANLRLLIIFCFALCGLIGAALAFNEKVDTLQAWLHEENVQEVSQNDVTKEVIELLLRVYHDLQGEDEQKSLKIKKLAELQNFFRKIENPNKSQREEPKCDRDSLAERAELLASNQKYRRINAYIGHYNLLQYKYCVHHSLEAEVQKALDANIGTLGSHQGDLVELIRMIMEQKCFKFKITYKDEKIEKDSALIHTYLEEETESEPEVVNRSGSRGPIRLKSKSKSNNDYDSKQPQRCIAQGIAEWIRIRNKNIKKESDFNRFYKQTLMPILHNVPDELMRLKSDYKLLMSQDSKLPEELNYSRFFVDWINLVAIKKLLEEGQGDVQGAAWKEFNKPWWGKFRLPK